MPSVQHLDPFHRDDHALEASLHDHHHLSLHQDNVDSSHPQDIQFQHVHHSQLETEASLDLHPGTRTHSHMEDVMGPDGPRSGCVFFWFAFAPVDPPHCQFSIHIHMRTRNVCKCVCVCVCVCVGVFYFQLFCTCSSASKFQCADISAKDHTIDPVSSVQRKPRVLPSSLIPVLRSTTMLLVTWTPHLPRRGKRVATTPALMVQARVLVRMGRTRWNKGPLPRSRL